MDDLRRAPRLGADHTEDPLVARQPGKATRPREISLFEQWMGMTPEEWDALGDGDDAAPAEQPVAT
jgi:hypothetical protein